VSIVKAEAAKVRCRTCYHDHDYRHELPPPTKKDLKKAELFNEVLASVAPAGLEPESASAGDPEPVAAASAEAKKKVRKIAKK
jgi:hypothetical protein